MPRTGNTTRRGYGWQHQVRRARWAPIVAKGRTKCWRCGLLIQLIPTPSGPKPEPWDLGHDDDDRRKYRGPEHRECNRAAGAAKTNAQRWGSESTSATSRTTTLKW